MPYRKKSGKVLCGCRGLSIGTCSPWGESVASVVVQLDAKKLVLEELSGYGSVPNYFGPRKWGDTMQKKKGQSAEGSRASANQQGKVAAAAKLGGPVITEPPQSRPLTYVAPQWADEDMLERFRERAGHG